MVKKSKAKGSGGGAKQSSDGGVPSSRFDPIRTSAPVVNDGMGTLVVHKTSSFMAKNNYWLNG